MTGRVAGARSGYSPDPGCVQSRGRSGAGGYGDRRVTPGVRARSFAQVTSYEDNIMFLLLFKDEY